MIKIQKIIEKNNLSLLRRSGISIVSVKDINQGSALSKNILYELADKSTVLFLSGGSTPKQLYATLAQEKKLNPGAVALVDERYGLPFSLNSNERMIRDTGLLSYLEEKKIPFYSILRLHPKGIASDLVKAYNKRVGSLLSRFSKRVAILGIGEDGHIAGLLARVQSSPARQRVRSQAKSGGKFKVQSYVREIRDFPGEFRERITLTFKALSKMDLLIVLVFGSSKKNILELMFKKGSIGEIPARFLKRVDIAKKTILITDYKVYNNY